MPEEGLEGQAGKEEREGAITSANVGEFVRQEIEPIRGGEQGAPSPEHAVATGLAEEQLTETRLPERKPGKEPVTRQPKRGLARTRKKPSRKRSRASKGALKRGRRRSMSKRAPSRRGKHTARRRSPRLRAAAAKKAARTRKRRR
jgi:hypothetical protein